MKLLRLNSPTYPLKSGYNVSVFLTPMFSSGYVVDVGIDNNGYRRNVWLSQFYCVAPNQAFLQVCNMEPDTILWTATFTIALRTTEDLPESPTVAYEVVQEGPIDMSASPSPAPSPTEENHVA